MENSKVVYIHKKETDGTIFYIGVGSLKRAYSKQRSNLWHRFVRKYGYVIEIYKEGLTKEEAFEIEIDLIGKYGRLDLRNGQLVNHTSGGLECIGLSNNVLSKKKKSLKGISRTKEWRDKISLGLKGKSKSEEHKEKIKQCLLGKKISEKTKEKMRTSNKSKIISSIPISCYDCDSNEFIFDFESVRYASKELGCLETSISNNLHGRSFSFYSNTLNKKIRCIKKLKQ